MDGIYLCRQRTLHLQTSPSFMVELVLLSFVEKSFCSIHILRICAIDVITPLHFSFKVNSENNFSVILLNIVNIEVDPLTSSAGVRYFHINFYVLLLCLCAMTSKSQIRRMQTYIFIFSPHMSIVLNLT